MVETTLPGGPRQYLRVFRHHVLDPIADAQARVGRERSEVAAEQSAFAEFRTTVADIEPVTATPSSPRWSIVSVDDRHGHVDRLRDAFRSTVMSVPHYDAVYDESLAEHMFAELGDPAAAVVGTAGTAITAAQQSALLSAIDRAIDDRDTYIDVLATEDSSLEAARDDIETVVEGLDDVIIQDWYQAEFEARLDEVVRERQAVVHDRVSPSPIDGRSLCAHLYVDEPWTFPVLTAVVRLHDAVVVD